MTSLYNKFMILSLSAVVLSACSPQKKEEVQAPVQIPVAQPEEVQPSETEGLSPQQAEELRINEDNVENPFPG